ncbi:MAG TPA: hypothetical protein VLF61_00980 [Rhabdochlamydiaceae bacterium]|nr:hypothetical protein [Rhabdochlamydiaceae bacterium]
MALAPTTIKDWSVEQEEIYTQKISQQYLLAELAGLDPTACLEIARRKLEELQKKTPQNEEEAFISAAQKCLLARRTFA